MNLIDRVRCFHESQDPLPDKLCRLYLLRIEHTYYKRDIKELKEIQEQIKQSEEKRAQSEMVSKEKEESEEKTETTEEIKEKEKSDIQIDEKTKKQEQDAAALLSRMCKYIYSNGSDRIRTRAMLCHIFHHALHDRWYEARDLILISHLQETIQYSDVPTQVWAPWLASD